MFGLSKRELEEKFKKSELVILAWRSQEMSHNLSEKTKDMGQGQGQRTSKGKRRVQDPSIPEGLPDKFFDENGEVNLSKVSGEEAWRYLSMQGIRLPVIGRGR
jgi:hypothetical protein